MKHYEVVAELGNGHHLYRIIEAEDEKQARKYMWEQIMSDDQKDNCADIEVFEA